MKATLKLALQQGEQFPCPVTSTHDTLKYNKTTGRIWCPTCKWESSINEWQGRQKAPSTS